MTSERADTPTKTTGQRARVPARPERNRVMAALVAALAFCGAATLAVRLARRVEGRTSCPPGLAGDDARARRIQDRLRRVDLGRQWLNRTNRLPAICFDEAETGTLRGDDLVVLPSAWTDEENAARLAHLLVHWVRGPRWPAVASGDTDCEDLVARTMDVEVEAHVVELELRRALGVSQHRDGLGMQGEYWSVPPAERRAVVARFVNGSGQASSLRQQYAARCRRLTGSPPGVPARKKHP